MALRTMLDTVSRYLAGFYRSVEKFRVERVSGIILPDEIPVDRKVPEVTRRQYSGRFARYDYKTLFYDIFYDHRRIILSGPPLMNLRTLINKNNIRLDGRVLNKKIVLLDKKRTQRSYIKTIGRPKWFSVDIMGHVMSAPVRLRDDETFKEGRVLVTQSKNNPLEWIYDWAYFYSKVHGFDSVLLYDNDSGNYSPEDIVDTIKQVPDIESAIVVPWPFKFGPNKEHPGVTGNANFSQISILNHARLRFLQRAAAMMHVDVDELLLPIDGRSVFQHLREEELGAIRFSGTWIESVGAPPDVLQRFRHFGHVLKSPDSDQSPVLPKWVADLRRIPKETDFTVHGVHGMREKPPISPHLTLLHFRGMSTNWKETRNQPAPIDPIRHVPHEQWCRIRDQVFGMEAEG